MRILLVVSNYPHPGHKFSGIFNERSAQAFKKCCESVTVLAPKPYVPFALKVLPGSLRWAAYARAATLETREGIEIHRPDCLTVPKINSAFWLDYGAFLCCRNVVRTLHQRITFDAIFSFDLVTAGGLAWRLGNDLRIPACGWATGGDMRQRKGSPLENVLVRSLKQLDLVFYQSRELHEIGRSLLEEHGHQYVDERHVVLSRGIPEPPNLPVERLREQIRSEWKVSPDQILVMSIGRIARSKGVFELLEALSIAAAADRRIVCCLVGAKPGFDQSEELERAIEQKPSLKGRIRIFPSCEPSKVWALLSAADINVFASPKEGMPNSLLEAMAMSVPSVTFAIPPVLEIDPNNEALLAVPAFNVRSFADAILLLANSAEKRADIGKVGRDLVIQRYMVRDSMALAIRHLAAVSKPDSSSKSELSVTREP